MAKRSVPLRETLMSPAGALTARRFLIAGALAASLGLVVAVAFAAPVAPAKRDFAVAGTGALFVALGAYLMRLGWTHSSTRWRSAVTTVALLATTSFVVGALADPIVLDGQVLVETSGKAQAVRMADMVYDDLHTIAEYDDLLVAPIEDARANVSAYKPAVESLYDLSADYSQRESGDLPDPAFKAVVAAMKTTSYWGAKAMETKTGLIEQEDGRAEADLETQRASFTDNWVAAATELRKVADALDIPYTTDLEGPHE